MPALYRYDTCEEMIGDPKWHRLTAEVRGIAQVMALNIARPRDLSHLGLARTPVHKIFPILDARG